MMHFVTCKAFPDFDATTVDESYPELASGAKISSSVLSVEAGSADGVNDPASETKDKEDSKDTRQHHHDGAYAVLRGLVFGCHHRSLYLNKSGTGHLIWFFNAKKVQSGRRNIN